MSRDEDQSKRDDDSEGRSPLAKAMADAGPFLELGWVFVAATGAGVLAGWWLDKKFATTPWLLVAGSLLGIAVGFVNLIQTTLRMNQDKDQRKGKAR